MRARKSGWHCCPAPGNASTYPVEVDGYGAIGVDGGGLAAERDDFAEDTHGLVHEVLEVVGVDAGRRF